MTITAVVCSYWENRRQNVPKIVDSFRSGTVVPDHIMVLNNNPDYFWGEVEGADTVIETGYNYECRGKFIAPMMKYSDFYLMADDDTALGPETLEQWMYWATDDKVGGEDFVTGYWGVRLNNRSFMKGQIIQPHTIRTPQQVDAFHGRVMFMGNGAMMNMLHLEQYVRAKWPTEGDDLIAGVANPQSSWIVPLSGDSLLVDLDEGGQAMQFEEGYFDMRDRFASDVLDAAESIGLR